MTGDVPLRLQLTAVTKSFPAVVACDHVDLSVRAGSIHAVLGENGAGKSTLMKLIYGVLRPDSGAMRLDGRRYDPGSPAAARAAGIGMVFQHFSLFPALTVIENLVMAQPARARVGAIREKALGLMARYDLQVGIDSPVGLLSVGERQRVEIVRALLQDPRLLILDEPTSVLTPSAIGKLFETLRLLARSGTSILYISHKLHEVIALCDRATIMRGGRVVADVNPGEESETSLARWMLGDVPTATARSNMTPSSRPVLTVTSLAAADRAGQRVALQPVSFTVRAGEILGIAGIAGNGQQQLLDLISGERRPAAGSRIEVDGEDVTYASPSLRRLAGLAYIPEERNGHGAVPQHPLWKNALLSAAHRGLVRHGLIDRAKAVQFAEACIDRHGVRCSGAAAEARTLSGGNLQKFIVGRELAQDPKVIVVAEPTWGLDVGAAQAVHAALMARREAGAGVLLVSEDLDELLALADRVVVIAGGKLSPIWDAGGVSIEEIGRWMGGEADALAT